MGEGRLPLRSLDRGPNRLPVPAISSRPLNLLSHPAPLSASCPRPHPHPLPPQPPNLRLSAVIGGSGVAGWGYSSRFPVPRHPFAHSTSPGSPSPDQRPQVPEAEAGSSCLAWDAYHGRGWLPLSPELGCTRVSQSAAPGQRKPLEASNLISEAYCRRDPHRPGSCSRITNRTCGSSAPLRRVRVPGEPASERERGQTGWTRGYGRRTPRGRRARWRCRRWDCSATSPEKSPQAHTPGAHKHVHIAGCENPSQQEPFEYRTRFSDGFCPEQQNSRSRNCPGLQSRCPRWPRLENRSGS